MSERSHSQRAERAAITNAISVDVEDYYHVWALSKAIPRRDWPRQESRVAESTGRVLDLFAEAGVAATMTSRLVVCSGMFSRVNRTSATMLKPTACIRVAAARSTKTRRDEVPGEFTANLPAPAPARALPDAPRREARSPPP